MFWSLLTKVVQLLTVLFLRNMAMKLDRMEDMLGFQWGSTELDEMGDKLVRLVATQDRWLAQLAAA